MSTLAEQVVAQLKTDMDNVYDAGYQKGAKESDGYGVGYSRGQNDFGIPNEVTGTHCVHLDYVNENPHNVKVQLSSDTITDFSGIEVRVVKRNLINKELLKDIANYDHTDLPYFRKYYWLKPNTLYKVKAKKPQTGDNNSIYGTFLGNGLYDNNAASGLIVIANDNAVDNELVFNTVDDGLIIIKSNGNGIGHVVESTREHFKEIIDSTEVMVYRYEKGLKCEYEPYYEEVYYANADGTVDGITSISPVMSIMCEGVDITAKYYQTQTVEYDKFWDTYLQYGTRTFFYDGGFDNEGWTDSIFKPKYVIKPTSIHSLFTDSLITEINVKDEILDVSEVTSPFQMFYGANVVTIGTLNFAKATNLQRVFTGAKKLKYIGELRNIQQECTFSDTFQTCESLRQISITGIIGKSINFQWSTLLEVESAKNIIQCLANLIETNPFTQTITFHANVWSALDAEGNASPSGNTWKEYIESIGWLSA